MPRGRRKTEAEREAERLAKEEEKQRKAQAREEAKQRKADERAAVKEAEKCRKNKERDEAKQRKAAEKEAAKQQKTQEKIAADAANEPKTKWKKSKAKQLLYTDLKEGLVPLEAKDENGKSTMKLSDIYGMHPEYADYHYDKFSSRLSSLRKTVKDRIERQRLDQEAFENYRANHAVKKFHITHTTGTSSGKDQPHKSCV